MTVLQFHNLSYALEDKGYILKDINLSFAANTISIILGPNGSGKTMLARHALALTQPTEGYISVKGEKISKNNLQTLRKQIGMVFQESERQFIGQTIEEELQCGLEHNIRNAAKRTSHIEPILERFSFAGREKDSPLELSGGEKRRLAIASVYAMRPALVFIDEPFYALDYQGCKLAMQSILDLRQGGSTPVVITHEYQHILAHADRVILLVKGMLHYDGEPVGVLPLLKEAGLQPPLIPLKKMTCV